MPYAASEPRMSDTPPDRKEAGDAPAGPRNPWVGWLTWAVLTPVLYVLSVGPARWLHNHGIAQRAFQAIYSPLDKLPSSLKEPLLDYARWWSP